jgi:hypothetical protein
MEAEIDQLFHHYFEAVNNLYPPWGGEDILVKTARVVDLKLKINQLDPRWKLVDSDNGHVFRILLYLDKMDADVSLAYNHSLSLKICEEMNSITHRPWHLNGEVVRNFNSERKKESEKNQDQKKDLARIAVNVQVALDVEKNDQATDSEEDGAKRAFRIAGLPFVFLKDLK